MVVPAHDFWCHVARSARSVLMVVWFKYTGNSKIGDSYVALIIKHKVLRFYISVYDALILHILEGQYHTCDKELWKLNAYKFDFL